MFKFIKASEARELFEKNKYEYIYKEIERCAKTGSLYYRFKFKGTEFELDKCVARLKEDGYKVDIQRYLGLEDETIYLCIYW